MQKIINIFKKYIFIVIVFLISVPTFWQMVKPGIYSMQDFHFFRLFEFDKCVQNLQIPCRWSPDAGLGYGEPLFNFYSQGAYWVGEVFHLVGFSFIDSLKLIFIFSLVGSGVAMFFLSKKLWGSDWAAIVSSALYIYAPYRAVDVWVRGALPEALSFVVFPLIILSIEYKNTLWFSLLLALLILTHNLSLILFIPFLAVWVLYRKFWKAIPAGIVALLLSAFYVLPVIFESKFINIESTIRGYFDFRAHFITSQQIFLDMSWGYGGSTWGDGDGMNLSVGLLQWIISIVTLLFLFIQKKIGKNFLFLPIFILGFIYLFLTHNKSAFIWELFPFMAYIQFPWRFLGMATFCFALASGVIADLVKLKLIVFVVLAVVSLLLIINYSFFRPDIWYNVSDSYFTTGPEWDRQRIASIGDYWPNFGHSIPDKPATGEFVNYFPGWISSEPQKNGLILSNGAVFKDTSIRSIGNIISLVSLLAVLIWRKKL